MNADTRVPDLAACADFAGLWCGFTAAPHLTLTAITPDGPTTTATFARGAAVRLRAFVAREQGMSRNIYFQPNETPPGCASKASKGAMVAAACRHADVDPDDAHHPLADERDRLHRLAAELAADLVMPPTVILDSGNGLQPLWVVAREPLTPDAMERVERENRAVEAALGAAGTHDVSRLLRLPGTVNFPNKVKVKLGRGVSGARVLSQGGRSYETEDAARLGPHLVSLLAGKGLVRPMAAPEAAGGTADDDVVVARLHRALASGGLLARRWAGDASGLKDTTRSTLAMSLCALLRREGFDRDDTFHLLRRHPAVGPWCVEKGDLDGARELRRFWDKAGDTASQDAGPPPEPDLRVLRLHRRLPPALPLAVFGPWAGWIADAADAAAAAPDYVAAPLLAAASATIGNARWAKAHGGWAEPPHLWMASVGDSGSGKSPGADVILGTVLPPTETAMSADFPEKRREWEAAAEATKARREAWEKDVKLAARLGNAPPLPPTDSGEPPEPQAPCLRLNDASIERVALMLAGGSPKGLLMVRDELAGHLLGMTSYNDGARGFWIEAFGGRPYRVHRVKFADPIQVSHLAVAWWGGTQPSRLAEIMRGADDGLLARHVWIWPEGVPFDLPRAVPDVSWAVAAFDKLRRLEMMQAEAGLTPILVPLAADALTDMRDFARDMQERQRWAGGLLSSTLGKGRGLALRLSLVLQYLWWAGASGMEAPPAVISREAFAAAATLVADYFIPMAERTYGDAAAPARDRDAATLARWIQKERPQEVHVRALQKDVRLPGLATAEAIHEAARVLVESGWLLPSPGAAGQPGRPKAAYPVNPALWNVLP